MQQKIIRTIWIVSGILIGIGFWHLIKVFWNKKDIFLRLILEDETFYQININDFLHFVIVFAGVGIVIIFIKVLIRNL